MSMRLHLWCVEQCAAPAPPLQAPTVGSSNLRAAPDRTAAGDYAAQSCCSSSILLNFPTTTVGVTACSSASTLLMPALNGSGSGGRGGGEGQHTACSRQLVLQLLAWWAYPARD